METEKNRRFLAFCFFRYSAVNEGNTLVTWGATFNCFQYLGFSSPAYWWNLLQDSKFPCKFKVSCQQWQQLEPKQGHLFVTGRPLKDWGPSRQQAAWKGRDRNQCLPYNQQTLVHCESLVSTAKARISAGTDVAKKVPELRKESCFHFLWRFFLEKNSAC